MVSTDLAACEWFVWDLRRSNLIDRGRLDQVINDFLQKNPRAEPQALADFLVSQNILTQFQAEPPLARKNAGLRPGTVHAHGRPSAGSMGTVYKARNKTDNQWYAVKVLPRRSMWNVRIARRKVRAFEQCKHPSVVPFVDVGTAGGMHYLAWPLVEGEPLDRLVQREEATARTRRSHRPTGRPGAGGVPSADVDSRPDQAVEPPRRAGSSGLHPRLRYRLPARRDGG